MRVLIFSHEHPTFSKGGGEFAAYYLYQGFNESSEHEAWFVGRAEDKMLHPGVPIAALNEREYLIAGQAGIPQLTTCLELGEQSDFAYMLKTIQPDVIHFHHYVNLGLELIRAVKNLCPKAKVVLTLHEYIAICMNNGQMIKTDGRLCYRYSLRECIQCFPEKTAEDFFLRERYIKSFFDIVDHFISPSEFLKDRYINWGIDAERIAVIENGLPAAEKHPPRALQSNEIHGRFAYFGQINPYKGVNVLLDAFTKLPKSIKKRITLDIFGSGLEKQSPEYQKKFHTLLQENSKFIRFHGAYEAIEQARLMAEIDWVVMSSMWWENSPLVIQEAFKYGRPVICPDIGGMAEKVTHGVNGMHFRARDAVSLSQAIESISNDTEIYNKLSSNIPKITTIEQCVEKHMQIYAT
ncbi:MAG: glycosyltransferase family 4 protein [Methylococcaceae bacterium]|nr:glycosyltransferase family 4 protein [Methylococcaceae bacterium]